MMHIVITGGEGFVGLHLNNFLSTKYGVKVTLVGKAIFNDLNLLSQVVAKSNVIIHLAAVNRHESDDFIATENFRLATHLTDACDRAEVVPHILFASSSQEYLDNTYGNAKKNAREHLQNWSAIKGGKVSGLIIPNVFGPFGRPEYNSFIATFCHKIARDEAPTVLNDKSVDLIYVLDLIEDFYQEILHPCCGKIDIKPRYTKNVSEVLQLLMRYKEEYQEKGIFPNLQDKFELSLFNTYRCYIPHDHFPVPFTLNSDARGTFVEIARTNTPGQSSYSITNPGFTRGNHFHTRKAERFAVIKGKARIDLRKVDSTEVVSYIIDGDVQPAYVDMPIWHTHNITNIGNDELLTMFWINEPYNQEDPDTYFVNV
jgi:UDP-2-acetamido-2,6-beta-L-arabino-hexul-4-ose reductase